MKKFITAGIILSLALGGAPQASAFSSGSSGSNIVQPQPEPTPPIDVNAVIRTLASGYIAHYEARGYTFNEHADNLARMYYEATPYQREILRQELNAINAEVSVETFATDTYMAKYNQLVNTPQQPYNGRLFGAYIAVGEYSTTVTIVHSR